MSYSAKHQKDYRERMKADGYIYKSTWMKKRTASILNKVYSVDWPKNEIDKQLEKSLFHLFGKLKEKTQ